MPEASFYILSSQSQQERYLFACKLIEKAYRSKQFCYVYTDSQQQSQQLDNQLWSFRPGSFIPHQIYTDSIPDYEKTILIGSHSVPEKWRNIIVNISSRYPEGLAQTERVIEILDNNEIVIQAGRQRFRLYEQNGFNTTTHKIGKT